MATKNPATKTTPRRVIASTTKAVPAKAAPTKKADAAETSTERAPHSTMGAAEAVVHAATPRVRHEPQPINAAGGDTPSDVLEQASAEQVLVNLGVAHGEGESPVQIKSTKEVTVVVPKAFDLTYDNGKPKRYEVGVQEMPLSDATHWYSRAQGVTIYKAK